MGRDIFCIYVHTSIYTTFALLRVIDNLFLKYFFLLFTDFVKMSVIVRLQNLPWAANAVDIRQYFHGLSIPEGGVHIVGGELGDAFIAFR